jgi:hypothetical protein
MLESSSPKSSRFRAWMGWLAFFTVVIVGVLWVVLVGDMDFYRPVRPLVCESPAPTRHPVRFLAFGDWGEGTFFQRALAQQMVALYRQKPFQDIISLGDNIYEEGDIKQYGHDYFEAPYAQLWKAGVHFYPAIGNHDIKQGHMQDQIAYFKMPGEYYTVSEGPVTFFIINTTRFVRNPEQIAWLEKSLKGSKATWKIVAGHHPLYSSGRHGETTGLKKILEPMMIKYGVDAYLCGHDHDYERFKPVHGVHYIVSGGGGAFLTGFRKLQPYSLVHFKAHHFLFFEVDGNDLWMKAISRYGDVIDCAHWHKGAA